MLSEASLWMLQKKLQNFENGRVAQVDINNYNYIENAYFVIVFLSGTPPSQATDGLASLADLFPIWPLFLPFSPTAEPGPRLLRWYPSYKLS